MISAAAIATVMIGDGLAATCQFDGVSSYVCTSSGTASTVNAPTTALPTSTPTAAAATSELPPLRYLAIGTDASGPCWYWSRVAGLDSWDPANDGTILFTTIRLRECASTSQSGGTASSAEGLAWSVYRTWELEAPAPSLSPAGTGITGLATYVATNRPDPITHGETLPTGVALEVEAEVTDVTVDWGDGTTTVHDLAAMTGHPYGTATHTYTHKTCTPEYRETHSAGHLCHPTLEAYPIRVTFTWTARYRAGGPWSTLESVTREATVAYDVDEVIGVLES